MFDKTDLIRCETLIRLIVRDETKFSLTGAEVYDLGASLVWLGKMRGEIAKELTPRPKKKKASRKKVKKNGNRDIGSV